MAWFTHDDTSPFGRIIRCRCSNDVSYTRCDPLLSLRVTRNFVRIDAVAVVCAVLDTIEHIFQIASKDRELKHFRILLNFCEICAARRKRKVFLQLC